MEMSVDDIVSIEMIKPSFSTPSHLRNHNLSSFDQSAPSIHFHIILYYKANSLNYEEMSVKLKQSLSNALVKYYPLAGRIRDDNSWVDCNDAGIEYVEARFAHIQLSDVLDKSQHADGLTRFVSIVPRGGIDIPLSIKVNVFGCGGIAIGISTSHKVADGMSLVTFLNTWAATCREDTNSEQFIIKPSIGSMTSRFPRKDVPLCPPPPPPDPPGNNWPVNVVTKTYVFDEPKLVILKNLIAKEPYTNPTKVEAVTAFFWKNLIDAVTTRDKNKDKKVRFHVLHAVDTRSRASPPFPDYYFGNASTQAVATEDMTNSVKEGGECKCTYHDLAVKIRESFRKVNVDYIKQMELDGDNCYKYLALSDDEVNEKMTQEVCNFSSWSSFRFYDVDYGWGKPVWISPTAIPAKNLILLLPTESGNGIEAWVNMVEEDFEFIDTNYHLLSY